MISSGIIHDKNLHLLFCYSSTLILVELPGDTQNCHGIGIVIFARVWLMLIRKLALGQRL